MLGATLYEDSQRVESHASSSVRVALDFKFSITGDEFNLSSNNNPSVFSTNSHQKFEAIRSE